MQRAPNCHSVTFFAATVSAKIDSVEKGTTTVKIVLHDGMQYQIKQDLKKSIEIDGCGNGNLEHTNCLFVDLFENRYTIINQFNKSCIYPI